MNIMKTTFNMLKSIFLDVYVLYKNILHWNISKILITIYSFVLALISTFPFLIILLIYIYFSDINWSLLINDIFIWTLSIESISSIVENMYSFIFWIINIFLIILFFILGLSYSKIFLNTISLKYLKWKEFKYFKKSYFDIFKLWKYFQISFWNILFLAIPVVIFLFLILILTLFIWDGEQIKLLVTANSINYFTVLSFLFFSLSLLGFIYILYRIYFSYIIFADIWNTQKAYYYVKESFKLTKWYINIVKILFIIIIFTLLILPFEKTLKYFENNKEDIINYIVYNNAKDEEKEELNSKEPYYYDGLTLEYSKKDKEYLMNTVKKYNIYIILLNIFNFIVIYWLIEMVLVSFYKRELLK